MSYEIYRLIHLGGLMLLFFGLGAAVFSSQEKPRGGMALHGIGVLMMLVAGFGMLAKRGYSATEGWVLAKIGVWVVLAILPVLVRKKKLPATIGLLLAVGAGVGAAYLAVNKPF